MAKKLNPALNSLGYQIYLYYYNTVMENHRRESAPPPPAQNMGGEFINLQEMSRVLGLDNDEIVEHEENIVYEESLDIEDRIIAAIDGDEPEFSMDEELETVEDDYEDDPRFDEHQMTRAEKRIVERDERILLALENAEELPNDGQLFSSPIVELQVEKPSLDGYGYGNNLGVNRRADARRQRMIIANRRRKERFADEMVA